jgi:hypothetical protein
MALRQGTNRASERLPLRVQFIRVRVQAMFFFFSNTVGWVASIAISILITLVLLKSCS